MHLEPSREPWSAPCPGECHPARAGLGFPLQNLSLWAISQGCIFASFPTAEALGFPPRQLRSVGQTSWGERPPRVGCWRHWSCTLIYAPAPWASSSHGSVQYPGTRCRSSCVPPPAPLSWNQGSWLPAPGLLFNPCSEGSSLSPGRETIPPPRVCFRWWIQHSPCQLCLFPSGWGGEGGHFTNFHPWP